MSVYSNNVNFHMNEIPIIEFRESGQNGVIIVASVAMTYEFLTTFRDTLNNLIEQRDKKLNELQRTKENMN